uniref:Uncharacterized protein n=1 Tax=Zooxanthella nutricula TaxID=1333877 RepID=A0A7S2NXH4_9DINO|mmetsp:Transcript_42114/g.127259  ORF Transcript_42114/g.127259 Transcript_42114/m.127259 type:complete len:311 (+) Transcript_42114:98-1030(+)
MGVPLMKKPAGARASAGEAPASTLKRPAAATLLKRPAAAATNEEDGEEFDKGEAVKQADANGPKEGDGSDDKSKALQARAAVNEVRKQQRVVSRLLAEQERLSQKIKANRAAHRKAEQDLESLKEVAKKKSRSLGAIKAAKMRKQMEVKAMRAKSSGEKALAAEKSARKRMSQMRDGLAAVRTKAADAESACKRAQKAFDEAKKKCAQLKAQGEDVPEDGEKDLSAPGAWKPPGVTASKERSAAKAALEKAKAVWARAAEIAAAKEATHTTLKERMNEAKRKREAAEEMAGAAGGRAAPAKVAKKPAGRQ